MAFQIDKDIYVELLQESYHTQKDHIEALEEQLRLLKNEVNALSKDRETRLGESSQILVSRNTAKNPAVQGFMDSANTRMGRFRDLIEKDSLPGISGRPGASGEESEKL